jgi:hypothetical protein
MGPTGAQAQWPAGEAGTLDPQRRVNVRGTTLKGDAGTFGQDLSTT